MRKGFTLIELLVTMSIFTIVLSIIIYFYVQSQKHIVAEQKSGYLDEITVINVRKIRGEILRADRILEVQRHKVKLQMKTGEIDSIAETDSGVKINGRRFSSDAIDSIFFFWQDPVSSEKFFRDILDTDGNGILEQDEIRNLKILYIRYKAKKNKRLSEINSSVYLRI